jgi:hypothetical protein
MAASLGSLSAARFGSLLLQALSEQFVIYTSRWKMYYECQKVAELRSSVPEPL